MRYLIFILLYLPLFSFGQHHMMSVLASQSTAGASPQYLTDGGMATSIASGEVTLAVTCPSTVNTGDLLVCQMMTSQGSLFTEPAGWTLLHEASGTHSIAIFYRIADGTEDAASYNFIANNANYLTIGVIHLFSGALTTGTPFANTSASTSATRQVTTVAGYTISNNYSLAVAFFYERDDLPVATSGTGWTEQYEAGTTDGTDGLMAVATQAFDSPTTTPDVVFTLASTTDYTNYIRTEIRSE